MNVQPDLQPDAMLRLEDVSVDSAGSRALNHVSLTIDAGALHCLIGPDGAGKTALIDVISGRTQPDSGSAWFDRDIDLLQHDESDVARLGIWRKFQKPTVFEMHTVENNLVLAILKQKGLWFALNFKPSSAQRSRVEEILKVTGLDEYRDRRAGELSHGQTQWLELGILLAQDPKLLLIDKPVTGMTDQEREKTAGLLRTLAGEYTILLVESDMTFVRSIADRVTVLHEGSVLAEGLADAVQNDPDVVRAYRDV